MKKFLIIVMLCGGFYIYSQESCYESKYFDEFIETSIIRLDSVEKFNNSCELVLVLKNIGTKSFYLGRIIVYAVSLDSELTIGKTSFNIAKNDRARKWKYRLAVMRQNLILSIMRRSRKKFFFGILIMIIVM